jgi:hypothetical protein
MPASRLNFVVPRCVAVPRPVEANLSSFGLAFAAATSSPTLVTPAGLPATSRYGWLVSDAVGMKSFNGSYGRFFESAALYAWELVFNSSV